MPLLSIVEHNRDLYFLCILLEETLAKESIMILILCFLAESITFLNYFYPPNIVFIASLDVTDKGDDSGLIYFYISFILPLSL